MANHRWQYVGRPRRTGSRDAVCIHAGCSVRRRGDGGYLIGDHVEPIRPPCPSAAAPPAPRAPAPAPALPPPLSLRLSHGREFLFRLPPGGFTVKDVRRVAMHLLTFTEDWPDGQGVPELAGKLFLSSDSDVPAPAREASP